MPLFELGRRIDEAIGAHEGRAHAFLERLVAEPSVLGNERGAQAVLADELERLGFEVSWLEIPPGIGDDPAAGVPPLGYDGRAVVVGRLRGSGGGGRSLLVNGHLDVVPAGDPDAWSTPPFAPTRADDGWLHGRGAGDMKCGFAMAALATEALLAAAGRPRADLTVVGAIEEECTGNGTLATVRAGVVADGVLVAEPTDLKALTSGVGVVWVDVDIVGAPAHAEVAREGVNAIDKVWPVLEGLRALERELNDGLGAPRYHVNVGQLSAGDWPSVVPGAATVRARVGFPSTVAPDDAVARTRAAIAARAAEDPWLADHQPVVRPSGFRAAAYALDDDAELLSVLRAAHADAHGEPLEVVSTNGTTDARYYVNEARVPALCFGPRMRGMHGIDEAVELASIGAAARTVARFMANWMGL